jgi:hypothetical protein
MVCHQSSGLSPWHFGHNGYLSAMVEMQRNTGKQLPNIATAAGQVWRQANSGVNPE